MFCFPSQSRRKDRDKRQLPQDLSQSASALNHLHLLTTPQTLNTHCHSDTNISGLHPFSFFKSAVKSKPTLSLSGSCDPVPPESELRNSSTYNGLDTESPEESAPEAVPFEVRAEITYIDVDPSTPNLDEESLVMGPKNSVPLVNAEADAALPNNLRSKRRRNLPPMDVVNVVVDGSSGSEAIAPMASPERLSPGESVVGSPAVLDLPDSIGSGCLRPRFQLIHEGDLQVCLLNHTRTIVSKVLSSKFLRRWETHHVVLGDTHLSSRTPTGFLEKPVSYTNVLDVYTVQRWDKFCVRLVINDGSILLQANNWFVRDQWEQSIKWKRNIHKYRSILRKSSRPEVILKEIKNLVDFVTSSQVHDEAALQTPIAIISSLLNEDELWSPRSRREEVIEAMVPLLEDTPPTQEMSLFFSEHCLKHPRSPVTSSLFTPIVHRILKRNVDFGKSTYLRRFVAEYIKAIHLQNNGDEAIHRFVKGVHGAGCCCPHPRVLPNLVAATLAAIFSYYEQGRAVLTGIGIDRSVAVVADINETDADPTAHAHLHANATDESLAVTLMDKHLLCYLTLFLAISEVEDWRLGLAQLLQPVPVPDDALASTYFLRNLSPVIKNIGTDPRCEVHSLALGVRLGKDGWLDVYCPSNDACSDGGALWCQILETLLGCCCKRKSFLADMVKKVGALQLVALRDQPIAQEILCLMLEWQLLHSQEQQMQVVTTLQSTNRGMESYRQLCKRQDHLRELQQKGGPKKLTFPQRATDADVAQMLSQGSFGNLENLSLSFTHVTSACAQHLIQLPSLHHLNLWATQFGDKGLQVISDHLVQLEELNLCETPVTDKGIAAIGGITNLKKLNLNSTKLSTETLEKLKSDLPGLRELDIRYTDAW